MKRLVMISLIAVLASVGGCGSESTSTPLPERAEWSGKVLVASFWKRGCPACKRERQVLNRLHRESSTDVVVVGYALDGTSEADARKLGIEYPVQACDRVAFESQGGVQIPYTLVFDASRGLQDRFLGAPLESLRRSIDRARKAN